MGQQKKRDKVKVVLLDDTEEYLDLNVRQTKMISFEIEFDRCFLER